MEEWAIVITMVMIRIRDAEEPASLPSRLDVCQSPIIA